MRKQVVLWIDEEHHKLLKVEAAKRGTTIIDMVRFALDNVYFRKENGELAFKPELIERHPAPRKCDWCDGWCAVPCSSKPSGRREPMSLCQGNCVCAHGDPECKAAAEGRRIRALA